MTHGQIDEMRDWQDDAPSWGDAEFWPGATADEIQVSDPELAEVVC